MERVLGLNETFVHFLSPLDLTQLKALKEKAAYFRVVEAKGQAVAFLIAFSPNAAYESVNYSWFDDRFDDFAYIDRIVVAASAQGQALGVKLYNDLAAFARSHQLKQLTCEYNVKPMNEGSAKFHQRYGFKEIGQLDLENGKKRVSMQAYDLPIVGDT